MSSLINLSELAQTEILQQQPQPASSESKTNPLDGPAHDARTLREGTHQNVSAHTQFNRDVTQQQQQTNQPTGRTEHGQQWGPDSHHARRLLSSVRTLLATSSCEENRAALGVVIGFDFWLTVFPNCHPHYHKYEILLDNAVSIGGC